MEGPLGRTSERPESFGAFGGKSVILASKPEMKKALLGCGLVGSGREGNSYGRRRKPLVNARNWPARPPKGPAVARHATMS